MRVVQCTYVYGNGVMFALVMWIMKVDVTAALFAYTCTCIHDIVCCCPFCIGCLVTCVV